MAKTNVTPTREQVQNGIANLDILTSLLPITDYRESTMNTGSVRHKNPDDEGKWMAKEGMVTLDSATPDELVFTVRTTKDREHVVILSSKKSGANNEGVWMKKVIQNANSKTETKYFDMSGTPEHTLPALSKLECAVKHFLRTTALGLVENKGDNSIPRRIVNLLLLHPTLMLLGWVGCGKTHNLNLAYDLLCAEYGEWIFHGFTGSEGAKEEDLLTSFVPNVGGQGGFVGLPGVLRNAFKDASEGKNVFLYIDEMNRFNLRVQNIFIQALNLLRRPGFTGFELFNYLEQKKYSANTVFVPGKTQGCIRVVSSINIGDQGTYQMSTALKRRFAGMYSMYYLPPNEEAALIHKYTNGSLSIGVCKGMVAVANSVREAYRKMEYAAPLDTGSLIDWATTVAARIAPTPEIILESAQYTWFYKVVMYEANGVPAEESENALKLIIQSCLGSAKK